MSQISPKKSSVSLSPASKPDFFRRYTSWLYSLWKFSRPHTVVGTSLSVLGLYLIAFALNREQLPFNGLPAAHHLLPIALTWLTCLCGNIYIVGLNQLEDVAIDQINKPHLPLAAGEFSRREGWAIAGITGFLALLLPLWQGVFLMAMVWSSLLIGTMYSLPPIRLKRFPFWASLCIFTVRGAIVNLGLFLHFNQQFQRQVQNTVQDTVQNTVQNTVHYTIQIPAAVWALTLFILVFTFAIAIFKDIPDLEGDRRYHITTFTVRLGQQAVFNLARWVLTVCYLGMLLAGVLLPSINTPFLLVTHLLALGALWLMSLRVDLQSQTDIARFYQFIWKLFFLEYIIFPIACLMA